MNGKGEGKIEFTAKDLHRLRWEARTARARMKAEGLYGRCFEEERYEFAREYARGNTWNTERSKRFAERVRKHLDQRPA